MAKLTELEFDNIVDDVCAAIKETLVNKGREYRRNNNPMHNFDVGALMTGEIREKVIYSMALKHTISIADMRNDLVKGILPKKEVVEEKYTDAINYLILEKASILARLPE